MSIALFMLAVAMLVLGAPRINVKGGSPTAFVALLLLWYTMWLGSVTGVAWAAAWTWVNS